MERSHRPPPLNLTPPGSQRNSRQSSVSRITISVKGQSPTTISVFEEDTDDWNTGQYVTALRVFSDFVHILTCMILLLIMAFFLNYDDGAISGPFGAPAVFLLVLLGLDIILDFQSIGRYDKMWKGWALVLRLVFGMGYTSTFIAYIAMGRAFPAEYSYWGLTAQYATPMVYIFLWILGVWNLVYCAISRRQFTNEIRRYRAALSGDEQTSNTRTIKFGSARQWDAEARAGMPRPAVIRS
ncbi:hypothetical protein SAPIO_CDS8961 [Scedosporium apiospermum]|uniref:Uncharacterized protein n=1 Tax=Pseudallescheria apiosperma TaxID=563466 RepID=A0A084FY21_PSEDA|nr:uncharacterized protein SAPIO_CDS8961 [Scedosporium apiospermum]KEZ39983.1 hypothetical protein SAPIO_CDS8961 [Scedosporium apiospermum]